MENTYRKVDAIKISPTRDIESIDAEHWYGYTRIDRASGARPGHLTAAVRIVVVVHNRIG